MTLLVHFLISTLREVLYHMCFKCWSCEGLAVNQTAEIRENGRTKSKTLYQQNDTSNASLNPDL